MEFRELRFDDDGDARLLASIPAQKGRALRDLEARRWGYATNPAGSSAFAAVDGDEVVALYGVAARDCLSGGKERRFGEVVDAFESRPGHLALAARGLLDAHGGPKDLPVIYDWPDEATAGVTSKLLAFETVRTETVLFHFLAAKKKAAPPDVAPIERFDEQARWLYDRCAGEFGASTVRDATYLNWRFFERPGADYAVLGVRDGEGVLRGYAVTAAAGERVPRSQWIVDWLVPPDEPEVGAALWRAVTVAAQTAGVSALTTMLPPWSPWFDRFQRWGFHVHAVGRPLMHRSFVRRYDDLWLREFWWTTPADSLEV